MDSGVVILTGGAGQLQNNNNCKRCLSNASSLEKYLLCRRTAWALRWEVTGWRDKGGDGVLKQGKRADGIDIVWGYDRYNI